MKTFVHGAMSRGQESFKIVWRCHQLLSGFPANGQLSPEIFLFIINATRRLMMQLPFESASTRNTMWRENNLTAKELLKILQFETGYQVFTKN